MSRTTVGTGARGLEKDLGRGTASRSRIGSERSQQPVIVAGL
jgi:hypothetical protein